MPNTLFVDDTAAIPIRYTVKGLSEGIADIVLKYGDRVVATSKEPFTLNETEKLAGKTFASVLKFVPTKEDADSKKQEYSVTVTVSTGNGPGADIIANEISRPASVVNRKLKLLWVDSLPRRDFQFLQRELLRDRRVDAKFYLTEGDKQAMRSGPPWMIDFAREIDGPLHIEKDEFRKLLFEFDLLILGDVPGKFFNDEHKSVIAEFVKQGGGLIHIAGRWHAPHDWAIDKIRLDEENKGRKESERITPLADLLPVDIAPVRFPIQALDNPTGFVPVLAPAASRTQIVSLEDDPIDNAELWGKPGPPPVIPNDKLLKELFWYYPVIKVKPAADVFLTHPTARTPAPDNKPMPLLVGHHYGQGYVLFVGFDDTWRWRLQQPEQAHGAASGRRPSTPWAFPGSLEPGRRRFPATPLLRWSVLPAKSICVPSTRTSSRLELRQSSGHSKTLTPPRTRTAFSQWSSTRCPGSMASMSPRSLTTTPASTN